MPGGWPPGQRMTGRGDTRGTVPNIDKKKSSHPDPRIWDRRLAMWDIRRYKFTHLK